jgi:hypothetical protein
VDERRRALADPRVLIDECRSDDLLLAQAGRREEVLPPEVVRERMRGVGPRRYTLERFPAELETLRERTAAGRCPPALGFFDDRLANAGRRLGARVPDAAAGEDSSGPMWR